MRNFWVAFLGALGLRGTTWDLISKIGRSLAIMLFVMFQRDVFNQIHVEMEEIKNFYHNEMNLQHIRMIEPVSEYIKMRMHR